MEDSDSDYSRVSRVTRQKKKCWAITIQAVVEVATNFKESKKKLLF